MSSPHCNNCPDKSQQNYAAEAQQWEQLQFLLRGNCHPYHSSSSDIPQLLSTAKDDLQRCNDEIAKQQLYLVSLQKQRDLLERHVQGYESLISPIRKLPPEILRQIFLLVGDENRFYSNGIRIPGLILAHVCSHWRLVCFNTREIWATITIDTEESYSGRLTQAVRFLLEKSDPYPISLAIDRLYDTDHARNLLRAIVAESNRWSALTVGENVNLGLLVDVFSVIKSHLSSLRFLALPYLDDEIYGLDLFKVAPLLNTLDLDPDHQDPALPWAQLQNLTLREPGRPIHFLSICPALITAELICPTGYSVRPIRYTYRIESIISQD
ncbi:hypothetical protein C8J56DRAFT_499111 [Mycena floridula]|nr:hypothetical protein C8J56DRAFT_499111 [Mycena floridula]